MADPAMYSFYGAIIPVLRNLCKSAISTLTSAQTERTASQDAKFPSEKELLDTHFADMLPLHKQPILFAKFSLTPLEYFKLTSATIPSLDVEFKSLQDVIDFFTQLETAFAGVDEKAFNACAEKSFEMTVAGKEIKMSGFADYAHGFMVPHDYFHVMTIYTLLRSRGFALGKGVFVGSFMSETLGGDFAALRK